MALRNSGMMLATAIAVFSVAGPAATSDRDGFRHSGRNHLKHHSNGAGHHWKSPRNFYSGSVFVFRDRGNGTYVYGGGGGSSLIVDPLVILAPPAAPKIIDVAAESDPCSYENGVCVIRGSN